ncbi:hypothetical protein [Arthrobacter sp. ov118]|uniref:hypothetical protein n=1 Tax=Arthrobacter sp. ov118 TaxID=1761747 RepID=UPI0008E51F01|nr:hypothetical protein [Arthrobacter sp. ov118]SFT92820.1 hypothetical protein SAMN04487915_105215 [Arthrobacter sp. ov118]
MTGRNNERPGPNEALAAGRAGGAPVVAKPDRFARPYPMLENIIEGMTRVPQEFRRPTGTITRKSQQVMQFPALPAMKE